MATDKKKKAVKVRDLKPSKDAKGGAGRSNAGARHNLSAGGSFSGFGSNKNSIGSNKLN